MLYGIFPASFFSRTIPSAAIFLFRAISSSTSAASVSKPGLLYSILMPSVFALLLSMPPLFRPKMLCTLLALGGISTLAATIPPANATHNTPETAVLMILPIILPSFFFCAITVNSFSFGYTTRFMAVLRSASTPLLDVILSYKPQNEPFSAQPVFLDAQFAKSFKLVSIFIVLIHKQEAALFVQDAIPSPSALRTAASPEGRGFLRTFRQNNSSPFRGSCRTK